MKNIIDTKVPVFQFKGEWFDAFGTPERTGVWYIYGESTNGKTSFLLMLIKELSNFGRVLFESYEEGLRSLSLQEGIKRLGLLGVNNRVLICLDSFQELKERLSKIKSQKIVIIDSLDMSGIRNVEQITKLAGEHPGKLFIFTGWAEGKEPKKNIGKDVKFIANQKIYIEGFRAFSLGRSIGIKGYLDVWKEEANRYHEFK